VDIRYPLTTPTEMEIFSLMPSSSFVLTPNISFHLILPPSKPYPYEENAHSKKLLHSEQEEYNYTFSALYRLLSTERKMAVVQLQKNWWGYIQPLKQEDVVKRLILVLLPIDFDLAVFGESFSTRDLVGQNSLERHFPSYDSNQSLLPIGSLSEEVVQTDIQRVLRYTRNLPDKANLLYSLCNKVRHTCVLFHAPQMLNWFIKLLISECELISRSRTLQGEQILRELVNALSSDPKKPLGAPPLHQPQMNLKSILN